MKQTKRISLCGATAAFFWLIIPSQAFIPRTAQAQAQVCQASGAHDAHGTVDCAICHGCGGGSYGFQETTFPRGTTTAGGVMSRGAQTTECSVGCHAPLGAAAEPITWDTAGPLPCTRCHVLATEGETVQSAHVTVSPGASPDSVRAGCQSCHVLDQHLGGLIRLDIEDGEPISIPVTGTSEELNAACESCHDGAGRSINGHAPPLLVGWRTQDGDFHGDRAGTGWGGTLAPPFHRGADALSCTDCHDPHSSSNAYLFGAVVNGEDVPSNTIDHTGVGAEALCERCHVGERHAGCFTDCHFGVDPAPAGTACFYCHGHEGITQNFDFPDETYHGTGSEGCDHCHAPANPWPEYRAPVIREATGPVVVDIGTDRATIVWTTDEPATSFVEYGYTTPNIVTGNDDFVTGHAITLEGLTLNSSYVFLVRSADRYRNTVRSEILAFRTRDPNAPPAPILVDEPSFHTDMPIYSQVLTLQWSTVSAPSGDPVEYRVVVSHAATFDQLITDSGWITASEYTAPFASEEYPGIPYFWRVMARDAMAGTTSPWSTADSFSGYAWDPYEW